MTVRATTLKSAAAGRYYVEDLPRYYLEAGEPPGRWLGRGAALSGLAGEVDAEAFINVMAGLDPSGRTARGRRYGETSVRGYDVTCSAPKSVSVLWAVANPEVRAQVVASHDAAVAAVVEFIDEQATTRPTIDGEVVVVDARGVTAAAFRQHTSRAVDPQLHTHVVVAAKVQDPAGRWLALDGRMLKCDQRTLSALYHAGLRAELTRRLGVTWTTPTDGIAELATIDRRVLEAFSKRTAQHARPSRRRTSRRNHCSLPRGGRSTSRHSGSRSGIGVGSTTTSCGRLLTGSSGALRRPHRGAVSARPAKTGYLELTALAITK